MFSAVTRRAKVLPLLCGLLVACSSPKPDRAADAKDPNTPAVVKGSAVVLPSDTTKFASVIRQVVSLDDAKRAVATDLAILGMAVTLGDRKMIGATYAPDAEFITADTTYKGAVAIANGLGTLGPARSLRDFQRRSVAMRVVDSTVIDSGTYALLTKRTGADSVIERGRYVTTWRVHAPPQSWLILRDRLYRDRTGKAK